jgi:hypothetical protein
LEASGGAGKLRAKANGKEQNNARRCLNSTLASPVYGFSLMKDLRLLIVFLSFLIASCGCACKHSPPQSNMVKAAQSPLATPTDADPDLKTSSEIELRRINSGCEGCDDYSLTLRRNAGDIFADASVTRMTLQTQKQRTGTLSAYYYNHLIQLIKSEGIMDMDDQYAMGWVDALVVKLTISIGDRHKIIRTANEGKVPLKLWGLYLAIDGAVAQTKWNDAK